MFSVDGQQKCLKLKSPDLSLFGLFRRPPHLLCPVWDVTEQMHLTQYWPAVVHACCQSGWSIKHHLQQDWIYLYIPRPLPLEGKVNDLHSAQSSFKQAKRNCRTNINIIVICFLKTGYHSFALMYWVQRHQLNSKKSSDGETCLLLCLGTATTEYSWTLHTFSSWIGFHAYIHLYIVFIFVRFFFS